MKLLGALTVLALAVAIPSLADVCLHTPLPRPTLPNNRKPSAAPPGAGYFVITRTAFTGNLGSNANAGGNTGLAAGNALCLYDLTHNTGWWGYSSANVRGMLTAAKVKAFLCDGTTCNNLQPNTAYYFASAYDTSAGSGSFTSDASGLGPNDSVAWSRADHFGGTNAFYINLVAYAWTGRAPGSATKWPNSSDTTYGTCTGWTSSANIAIKASMGVLTANTNAVRWSGFSNANQGNCSVGAPLICIVNP